MSSSTTGKAISETAAHYLKIFQHRSKDGIFSLREKAMDAFLEKGFPSRKDEDWKNTDLHSISSVQFAEAFSPENISDIREKIRLPQGSIVLFFIDGIFSKDHSFIPRRADLRISTLASALAESPALVNKNLGSLASKKDGFTSLNTALFTDGLFLHLPASTRLEEPVFILHYSSRKEPTGVFTRNLIIAEEQSRASVYELFFSGDQAEAFHNTVTEIHTGKSSEVQFLTLKDLGHGIRQVDSIFAELQSGSRFTSHTFTLKGGLVRNNLSIHLGGQEALSEMNGLFLSSGRDHFDHHTEVDHAVPHCNSNQLYKGIATGKSSAVFNGKIMVRKDAQKTNAFQSSKNLLLSDEANIFSKPQLEIFADDVKCSHGATTGQLDQEALFYLRARGLSLESARSLLVTAFAAELIERVPSEEVRSYLSSRMEEQLS